MTLSKLKPTFMKIMRATAKLQVIIISLLVLVLFGMALLQVNESIDPTIDEATLQQAQQEQISKRVRYDQKALEQIRDLTNIDVELTPNIGEHSDNPFSSE